MENIIDKITSYNLFNNLLPGVLFVVLLKGITSYSLIQNDLIIAAFVYYFVGLVISRVGSLLVDPALKWIKFVHFADQSNFIKASKVDQKLEVLSEQNNVYRTLVAVFVSVLFLKFFELLKASLFWLERIEMGIFFVLILFLLLFGYKKQTTYIVERIEHDLASHK